MSISQAVYEAQIQRITDLQARLAEAERDAARYRWLRDTPTLGFGIFIIIPTTGPERIAEPAEVDAAIDAFLTADSATPRETVSHD